MRVLLIFFLTFIISVCLAQTDSTSMHNLNIEIYEAAKNDDIEIITLLNRKKALLLDLKKAKEKDNKFLIRKYSIHIEGIEHELNRAKNKSISDQLNIHNTTLIMQDGFFVDLLIGAGKNRLGFPTAIGNVGVKVGNRFYFGKNKLYRPGIQFTWMKANFLYNIKYKYTEFGLTPLNVGFSNLFEFKENIGAELNLNFGFTTIFQTNSFYRIYYGYSFSPEVKFRFKSLSIGIETNISNYFYDTHQSVSSTLLNFYSISIGTVF